MGKKAKKGKATDPANGSVLASMMEIDELVGKVTFPPEAVAAAMIEQPRLYLEAAKYHVAKAKAQAAAKAALKEEEADVGAMFRKEAESDGRKVTERAVAEHVDSNADVREARQNLTDATVMELWGRYVVESFSQRSRMLESFVRMIGAETARESGFVKAALDRLGMDKLREDLAESFPG